MRPLLMPLRRLLLQVLLLLGLYFGSRAAFTLTNLHRFDGLSPGGFFRIAFFAIRYDLSAICAVNALYIILLFLPLPAWRWPLWERITQVVFVAGNSIAFLFEIADWAYFPYNFKRATADVLEMVSRKGDFWSVLPQYLVSYWYVPLAAAGAICALIFIDNRIRRATPLNAAPAVRYFPWGILVQVLLLVFAGGAATIGIRGGLQYIPIGLRNAVQVADSRYVPIVLNTPFSIITTLTTPSLGEVHYMSDEDARRIMPFRHQYHDRPLQRRNVVVIILESCSKEFTALGNGHSFTPFLDSLMRTGLDCTQAFANGQTSAEGIPAILAGIPTLMDEPYTTSNYGTNRITALPAALREEGYSSAFFHGGTNGTMSFDIFAAAAGFGRYSGRKEYGAEADYDGAWGIRDEPFLQYTAAQISQMQEPFFTSVFTLSAHPPYGLTDAARKGLPAGPLPVQQCIAYTDAALRRFFATAATQPWFSNTLFVITADHCSPQNGGGYYGQGLGQFAIPLLFYAPGDSTMRGIYSSPVQQLDILPSLLHYLGYSRPFFAFGNSIFSGEGPGPVITYQSNNYQWLDGPGLLQTGDTTAKGYYAYPADTFCRADLLRPGDRAQQTAMTRLRAFIQRYHEVLIHNAMQ